MSPALIAHRGESDDNVQTSRRCATVRERVLCSSYVFSLEVAPELRETHMVVELSESSLRPLLAARRGHIREAIVY